MLGTLQINDLTNLKMNDAKKKSKNKNKKMNDAVIIILQKSYSISGVVKQLYICKTSPENTIYLSELNS